MFLRCHRRKKDGKEHRYDSVEESRRLQSGKVVQRRVLYLGEINDSQQASWRKTLNVFDEQRQRATTLSLFPEDRPVPVDALDTIQVKLSEMQLRRARPYGNCWLGCELWRQLKLVSCRKSAAHHQAARPEAAQAEAIARDCSSTWENARAIAADGIVLDGWLFTPRETNGSIVMLLHGIGATRGAMAFHAGYLLRAGFTVLMPDSRGHGSSGGSVITYGIRESADVHAWAEWLFHERPIAHLYGLGESMGAAILLESLPREPRFRAVVAECSFDSFEDIAYYRLEHASGLGRWAAWPVVQAGFLYARAAHGIDLRQASPAMAIRMTRVPVLLIHGTGDVRTPPSQSAALHALNPQSTSLWLVPGAHHVSAFAASPQEYVRRVTEWFRSHP
jgi:hypothetical protein